ncbi:MAG: DUF2231 domain-containing protein [Nitrospirae bacterium]|nr:DUF2231 domain-containing protein [Candidatus Manganitrophaceae bacterium]
MRFYLLRSFFDLIALVTKRASFRQTGLWLLILGWLGGLAATLSGFLGEDAAKKIGVPEMTIDRHESFAIATLIVFAALMLIRWWRAFRPSDRKNIAYLIVAVIGLGLLATTGFLGGDLVYRYGAGVQPNPSAVRILPPVAPGG